MPPGAATILFPLEVIYNYFQDTLLFGLSGSRLGAGRTVAIRFTEIAVTGFRSVLPVRRTLTGQATR